MKSLFFIVAELGNAGVIQGFDFVLSFLLDVFLRGQCLSNNLSILLKKSLHFQRESEEPYSSQCFLYLFQKPLGQNCNIVGRGVPTPLFYEDPLYCLPLPFFKFCDTPFLKTTPSPLIYQSCLWEKSDAPLFSKISRTHPPPLYKWGFLTMCEMFFLLYCVAEHLRAVPGLVELQSGGQ